LRSIPDRYAAVQGAIPVDLAFSLGEPGAMVRNGRADLALLHRPQNDLTGLDSDDLHTQGRHPITFHSLGVGRRTSSCRLARVLRALTVADT
jgi:hypothetical protein